MAVVAAVSAHFQSIPGPVVAQEIQEVGEVEVVEEQRRKTLVVVGVEVVGLHQQIRAAVVEVEVGDHPQIRVEVVVAVAADHPQNPGVEGVVVAADH